MAKLKNCVICGKLVDASSVKDYCDACLAKNFNSFSEDQKEQAYALVRAYIWDNPGTKKTTVAEDTGVPLRMLDEWIAQGLIEEIKTAEYTRPKLCSGCGRKITSGILCEYCAAKNKPAETSDSPRAGFHSDAVKK